MEDNVQPVPPKKARKRPRDPSSWKREKAKRERYSAKDLPQYPTCKHNTKAFKCSSLRMRDIKLFHQTFYSSTSKIDQDVIILKHCALAPVSRHRPKNQSRGLKQTQTKCYVSDAQRRMIPVCQKAFLNILRIKKYRIQYVTRQFHKTGGSPKEARGGDRVSAKNAHKKKAVQAFINSFKCIESHYCRSQTSVRMYLPSDLNVKKMWRMYNAQADALLKVKQCYFRKIFNTCYNLGFGSPRTDVCSKCSELTECIKREADIQKRSNFIVEKRVHKLRAKAFYDLLRETPLHVKTLSYDCQKNQILPKVPDQAAYYSRQLYIYNFTIVEGSSKQTQNNENVHIYCWTEDERPKGSNEIASAVHHRLSNTDLTGIRTVRLFAHGCGGQNKNSMMVGMCSKWLAEAPENITAVELIFPVVGHSYIPPDRVFGRIEKVLKKKEVIVDPDEYKIVFSDHGTVHKLGVDWSVFDWKTATQEILKPPGSWHFNFAPCKRFILQRSGGQRIQVQGEPHYKSDYGAPKGVSKRGKNTMMIKPAILANVCAVKPLKLRDVQNLLAKHFGPNWKELDDLAFYKNLVATDNNDPEEGDVLCEAVEEANDLTV